MRAMRPLSPLAHAVCRRVDRVVAGRRRAAARWRAPWRRVDRFHAASGRPQCTTPRRSTRRRSDNRAAAAALPPSCRVRRRSARVPRCPSLRVRNRRRRAACLRPSRSLEKMPAAGMRCGIGVACGTTGVRPSRPSIARAAAPPPDDEHARPSARSRCTCRSRRTRLRPSTLPGPLAAASTCGRRRASRESGNAVDGIAEHPAASALRTPCNRRTRVRRVLQRERPRLAAVFRAIDARHARPGPMLSTTALFASKPSMSRKSSAFASGTDTETTSCRRRACAARCLRGRSPTRCSRRRRRCRASAR